MHAQPPAIKPFPPGYQSICSKNNAFLFRRPQHPGRPGFIPQLCLWPAGGWGTKLGKEPGGPSPLLLPVSGTLRSSQNHVPLHAQGLLELRGPKAKLESTSIPKPTQLDTAKVIQARCCAAPSWAVDAPTPCPWRIAVTQGLISHFALPAPTPSRRGACYPPVTFGWKDALSLAGPASGLISSLESSL